MEFLRIITVSILFSFTLALSDIIGSNHDLSYSSTNTIRTSDSTVNDICVFCHTPHGANSNYLDAPIWNKISNTQNYSTYGTTISGTTSYSQITNSSKLCLSCHDGLSAINSIVNSPGSGLGTGNVKMNGSSDSGPFLMPEGSSNLGINLQNTHPISIEYKEGRASLRQVSSDLGSGWTTSDGLNKVSSLLRKGNVECISCHDPHLGENESFLRSGNNIGSKLCFGCHAK